MPVSRDQIVAVARSWIGTPFHHQARVKGVGADCVGLTIGVALELGLIDARTAKSLPADYKPHPDPALMRRVLGEHMDSVWPAQVGDWVWMAAINQQPVHVCLLSGPDTIIHAHHGSGGVVEHSFRGLARTAKGAFSYRGIVDDG